MRIVKLLQENVKRISAVEISPEDGKPVIIGGKNGHGKSSLMDGIEMALGGNKSIPSEPLKRGENKGRIVLDLGELIVTRKFTQSGSTLTVTSKDGEKHSTPQSLLDGLFSKLTFDPLHFIRLGDSEKGKREQGVILMKIAGLDFTEKDKERAEVYEERADANKEVKRLEGALSALPFFPDAPKELISVEEITRKISAANEHNSQFETIKRKVENLVEDGTRNSKSIEESKTKIESLKAQLRIEETSLSNLEKERDRLRDEYAAEKLKYKNFVPQDIESLTTSLHGAESENEKYRKNLAHKEAATALEKGKENAQYLSTRLENLDIAKKDAIAAAEMPVAGLSVTEDGIVTFNGLPLDQASEAERLRISVAVGASINSKLRIMLCREGGALDHDSLDLLAKYAQDHDIQLWIETPHPGDKATVIIEDGLVKE